MPRSYFLFKIARVFSLPSQSRDVCDVLFVRVRIMIFCPDNITGMQPLMQDPPIAIYAEKHYLV